MTDADFLRSIAESPKDDAPRLIYADWLEERGQDARSEFIRVQCELEPLRCWQGGELGDPQSDKELGELRQFNRLRRRELELLAAFDQSGRLLVRRLQPEWAGGLREILSRDVGSWEFRRGFIESISLPCAAWLEHAGEILEAVPMLQDVSFSDLRPQLLNVENVSWMEVWIFPRDSNFVMPDEFDDAMLLYHNGREEAERTMCRCALIYAHNQLARKRRTSDENTSTS